MSYFSSRNKRDGQQSSPEQQNADWFWRDAYDPARHGDIIDEPLGWVGLR
jgi:hypothetical protein